MSDSKGCYLKNVLISLIKGHKNVPTLFEYEELK